MGKKTNLERHRQTASCSLCNHLMYYWYKIRKTPVCWQTSHREVRKCLRFAGDSRQVRDHLCYPCEELVKTTEAYTNLSYIVSRDETL